MKLSGKPATPISRLMSACLVISNIVVGSVALTRTTDTIQPLLWQKGMTRSEVGEVNVFRRFSSERRAKMVEFYNEVLALKPLPAAALGGNAMIRYPLGHSEVKLFPVAQGSAYKALPAQKVIGIRLLTFFYADEGALAARFKEHGFPAPDFQNLAKGSRKAALAQDPDGQWLELVVIPGAGAETLNRFEIGITVSDLEQSRVFYRDLMGLEEMQPVRDELLGTMRYSYRHGDMTINLWTFGDELPRDTNSAGIQYITWNVEGVDKIAKTRGARIDRPLSAPGSPRTVWLVDPDGVTNYFAQFAENNNQR
jgi:catechol 2,3-dioxygenase-like lactoylglutathione lyase family enzyme